MGHGGKGRGQKTGAGIGGRAERGARLSTGPIRPIGRLGPIGRIDFLLRAGNCTSTRPIGHICLIGPIGLNRSYPSYRSYRHYLPPPALLKKSPFTGIIVRVFTDRGRAADENPGLGSRDRGFPCAVREQRPETREAADASRRTGLRDVMKLIDDYNRVIDYVRISVTDRCNLRCRYCVDGDFPFIPHTEVLSYEEIIRFVRICASLGVRKVRLTGGEPLTRKDLPHLLKEIGAIEGITDISLTTNGVLSRTTWKSLRRRDSRGSTSASIR